MPHDELAKTIDAAFETRERIGPSTQGAVRDAVEHALDLLDRGEARVAERRADGSWHVHQWLKKAVLLSFRLNDTVRIDGGPGGSGWWDKVPSKFSGWSEARFREAGFGAVLAMGVFLGASTKIVDRDSGKIFRGEVPPYSVLVPGTIEGKPMAGSNLPGPALYCAVIVKRVDAQTRAKTSINELLRD